MLKKTSRDTGKLEGHINIVLKDKDGNIKKLFNLNFIGRMLRNLNIQAPKLFLFGSWKNELAIHNLITTAGKGLGTALLGAVGSPAACTYLELGIGTNAAAAADTALQSAITDSGLARAAATVTQQTTTTTNDTLQLVKQWTASGSKAITECGIFNASSSGSMFGRQVFSAINVVSTDTIQITYQVKLS